MARRDTNPFVTIASSGGLLPIPLLERLATETTSLPGTDADDYELLPGKRLREIVNRSWNDLLGTWAAFRQQMEADQDRVFTSGVTREKWLLPLLRELGFTKLDARGRIAVTDEEAERDWPVSHEWGERVPIHLLGPDIELDSRTKGVTGAATAAPHALVQELLNASDRHLWAIVSNGRRLRLLRDSTSLTRQAYVEFDLETMFENEVFADFTVLWLLCHRTRFEAELPENCWLEQWQHESHEQGVRALDELSNGVRTALEALGSGLLRNAANRELREALQDGQLSTADLYRQLLRMAYRLVFLFVVEDRELLHPPDASHEQRGRYHDHYSTTRLREQARRHGGGHHPDGWEHLKILFAGLGSPDGVPSLGLPSLVGGLFDPAWTTDIADTRMANRDLYSAVRALGYTQREGVLQRVDYRNLGSEELGSIYESLLGLHPKIDWDDRSFALRPAPGTERKSTGAYYTPTSLIAQLLDDALDPVVDEAVGGKGAEEAQEAILDLAICDPACGSAHFLVAAGHRLAKRLAAIRTGDPEPAPLATQEALRDVVGRCLYGVDMNPMAVELAKVSLWLECHVPGRPLTFLDHHIRFGNSLLGVHHPELIAWDPTAKKGERGGIPDAAFKQLHGDDKSVVRAAKDTNKQLREGRGTQEVLSFGGPPESDDLLNNASSRATSLRAMDDGTLDALNAKQEAWRSLDESDELARLRLAADAWCASFTIEKTNKSLTTRSQHPWDIYYAAQRGQELPKDNEGIRAVGLEDDCHNFFHWFAEFPDIHQAGGFDLMIGNPPWEQLQLEEKSWFSSRAPGIAQASGANRKKMIRQLRDAGKDAPDHTLAVEWESARRELDAQRHLVRDSSRFSLSAVGKLNLYALFAELMYKGSRATGRVALICPTGLAVGASYADFFGHLVRTQTISAFYSFENEDKVFPDVHNETKFALVVLTGEERPVDNIVFTGYVRQSNEINDPGRRYELRADDIEAINPNTLTAPLFRHSRDADVTATIHRNVPVLVREGDEKLDRWGFDYMTMFNMTSDSGDFISRDDAVSQGGRLEGAFFVMPHGRRLVPLYEGKMIWHYDHRYGTYESQTAKQANKGVLPHVTDSAHADPSYSILHRYWVPERLVDDALNGRWDRSWMIGFRDVGPSERTMVAAILPRVAAGDKVPLALSSRSPRQVAYFEAALASIPVDYALRQKTAGGMSLFVVKQAPVPHPPSESDTCPWSVEGVLDFVVPRVVELSYTAHDLAGFAHDCGMDGPPFWWEPERRSVIRAELDALFFHLYGLNRDDTEWVLNTFTVLRKYEEKAPEKGGCGEFRTKRLILERYDDMAKAIADRQEYVTPLDVPPGDDRARHAVTS